MKARSVVLTTLLFGVAIAVVGNAAQNAAQNTVSGNYRVDAVMAEGGQRLLGPAQVYVLDRRGDVVARRHAVPAVFDLGRGEFTAAIVYKHARGRGTIEPGTKPGDNSVNLKAGGVHLSLVTRRGEPHQRADLSWQVYRYRGAEDRGAEDRGAKVANSDIRRPELVLDAGWYEVVARRADGSGGVTIARHVIEVEAGRQQTYRIEAD